MISTYLGPVVLDPLFNQFTPLPAGPLRADVLELARQGRRRRRPGLRGRRVAAHDGGQRLRDRDRHTKRVVLYDTLLKDFTPGRDAARGRPRARPRPLPRRAARAALAGARGAVRDARRGAAGGAAGTARGPRGAGRGALARADRARRSRSISNQLSRAVERARRRASRCSSPTSPTAMIELRAPDHAAERRRPRPARLGVSSCSARTRRRWSGSARRSRYEDRLEPVLAISGRLLMPSLVRHLDQLSSMASISSRMNLGGQR